MDMNTKIRRKRGGGAAIEFALVLPPLLTILFGIMEFSWLFLEQSNVMTAAREGARRGVTVAPSASPSPASTAITRANAVLTSLGMSTTGASVTAAISGSSPSRTLEVNVNVPYHSLTGWDFPGMPATLHAHMSMLMEQQS
jgi:Flp pilus assembly protein TadG